MVAQQLLTVQNALRAGLDRFWFEGRPIRLVPSCGVFITMNPGYAGRTELPDNLEVRCWFCVGPNSPSSWSQGSKASRRLTASECQRGRRLHLPKHPERKPERNRASNPPQPPAARTGPLPAHGDDDS